VVAAAQDLLVPVTPDPLAASVLDEFFATVATLRELLNPGLRTLGIVLVRVRPHLRLGRQIAAELASRFPGLLLPVQVRDSVRAAEASSGQLPLLAAGGSSFVAEDYRRLADLLLAEGSGGMEWTPPATVCGIDVPESLVATKRRSPP
jgi:chromosome partitioning protein